MSELADELRDAFGAVDGITEAEAQEVARRRERRATMARGVAVGALAMLATLAAVNWAPWASRHAATRVSTGVVPGLQQPTYPCPARSVPDAIAKVLPNFGEHVTLGGADEWVCREDWLLATSGLPIVPYDANDPNAAARLGAVHIGTQAYPGAEVRDARGSLVGYYDPLRSPSVIAPGEVATLPAR